MEVSLSLLSSLFFFLSLPLSFVSLSFCLSTPTPLSPLLSLLPSPSSLSLFSCPSLLSRTLTRVQRRSSQFVFRIPEETNAAESGVGVLE